MEWHKILVLIVTASFWRLASATSTPFNANFDDLNPIPEEARLNPVGIYKNLSYVNFGANQPGLDNISFNGIMPESKPNQAVLTGNPANITSLYAGSKVKTFALSSFYYGCNLQLKQGAVDFATPCNFTATAYKAGSNIPFASQIFHFTPAGPLDTMNPLTLGAFTSQFQGLSVVSFDVEPSLIATGVVDNIVGTIQS